MIPSPVKDGRFGSKRATGSREDDLVVVRCWQHLGGPFGTGASRSGKLDVTLDVPWMLPGRYLEVTLDVPWFRPWVSPGSDLASRMLPGRALGTGLPTVLTRAGIRIAKDSGKGRVGVRSGSGLQQLGEAARRSRRVCGLGRSWALVVPVRPPLG